MKITLWNKKFSMIYEFVTAKKGDDFVGFRADNKKIEINLPIGYEISEDQLSLISENELRKKITELVFVIAEFKEKKEGSFQSFVVTKNNKQCNFPISACLYLIKDYFQNGYYKTKEITISKGNSGKINWAKTIKNVKPELTKSLEPIYLDYFIRKSKVNDHKLISEIHKYCVWYAFNTVGFLFSSFIPKQPSIKYDKKLFINVIKHNLKNTFAQKELFLFQNMLALLEKWDDDLSFDKVIFGTTDFEHVWEHMIDIAYGETGIFNKEDFFPYAEWHLNNVSGNAGNLYPDTICLFSQEKLHGCIIIDAKYYGYKDINYKTLPSMESIAKQIHYGQYVFKKASNFGIESPNTLIFNVFLIPANFSSKKNTKKPCYIGYAIEPWNDNEKMFEKIFCFAIDCQSLINNFSKDKERVDLLLRELRNQTMQT